MAQPGTITILCNGERLDVAAETSLLSFLFEIGHDPRSVAIEYNGTILRRDQFRSVILRQEDRLEIVRFVQGG